MRISNVRINNFRGLEDVEVVFDDVTTFLGPNGAGKSSILRALDWFFNGARGDSITLEDAYLRDPDRSVRVEVEFDRLTDTDRSQLGKYAPPGCPTVSLWKQWQNGVEKLYGRDSPSRLFIRCVKDLRRASGGVDGSNYALIQPILTCQPGLTILLWLPSWQIGRLHIRVSWWMPTSKAHHISLGSPAKPSCRASLTSSLSRQTFEHQKKRATQDPP